LLFLVVPTFEIKTRMETTIKKPRGDSTARKPRNCPGGRSVSFKALLRFRQFDAYG